MAPKRAGQTRRDAALDAMRRFGFKDSLIRESINELLKVYGTENWGFIETDCYQVLFESIFDKITQERPEQNHDNPINVRCQPDDNNIDGNQNQVNFVEYHPDRLTTELEVDYVHRMSEQVTRVQDEKLGDHDEEEMNKAEGKKDDFEENEDVMNQDDEVTRVQDDELGDHNEEEMDKAEEEKDDFEENEDVMNDGHVKFNFDLNEYPQDDEE